MPLATQFLKAQKPVGTLVQGPKAPRVAPPPDPVRPAPAHDDLELQPDAKPAATAAPRPSLALQVPRATGTGLALRRAAEMGASLSPPTSPINVQFADE